MLSTKRGPAKATPTRKVRRCRSISRPRATCSASSRPAPASSSTSTTPYPTRSIAEASPSSETTSGSKRTSARSVA